VLALADNQILVENDLISFPVSLRDDEPLFLVSDRPVEKISFATSIAIEMISVVV
jgi:hypothetical protein